VQLAIIQVLHLAAGQSPGGGNAESLPTPAESPERDVTEKEFHLIEVAEKKEVTPTNSDTKLKITFISNFINGDDDVALLLTHRQ